MSKLSIKMLNVFLSFLIVISVLPKNVISAVSETDYESFKTASNSRWIISHSSDCTSLSSTSDGGMMITVNSGINTASSGFSAVSEDVYPIQNLSFDVQTSYGSVDYSSYFGIKTVDKKKSFELRRMVSGTTTEIKAVINGETVTLLTVTGQLRTRIFSVGIKKNGDSWYFTYDGKIIDAANCSENAKKYVKLENQFGKYFLENNAVVHFFFGAASLNGYAYCHSRLDFRNGVILPSVTNYSDRNAGTTTNGRTGCPQDIITSLPVSPAEYEEIKDGCRIVFDGNGQKTVYTAVPVDSGFSFAMSMENTLNENQWINLTASNDFTFTDSSQKVDFKFIKYMDSFDGVYSGGEVTPRFKGLFDGSKCKFSFVDDVNASGKKLLKLYNDNYNVTAFSPDFSTVSGGKVYFKIATTEKMTLEISFEGVAPEISKSISDYNSLFGKNALDEYFASDYRFCDIEKVKKASKATVEYCNTLNTITSDIINTMNNLPNVNELKYNHKAVIEKLISDYYALDDVYRTQIDEAQLLSYGKAAENLIGDNQFKTSNGEVYLTQYNPDYINVSTDAYGMLIAKPVNGKNTENTSFKAITEKAYPILNTDYELSHYFGTIGTAWFGISTFGSIDKSLNSGFKIFRTETGANTVLMVNIAGSIKECAKYTATRANLSNITVVSKNGYHYFSLNEKVLDGSGFGKDVEEYMKLENHFEPEFFEKNLPVHFFIGSDCLYLNVYCHANVRLKDGALTRGKFSVGDRNGGYGSITGYNESSASIGNSDIKTYYNISLKPGTSATLYTPIHNNAFTLSGNMERKSINRYIEISFSNDPNFSDTSEVKLYFYQMANSTEFRAIIGQTTYFSGIYNLFDSTTYRCNFEKQPDGKYYLFLTAGANASATVSYDFSKYMQKPLYMKFSAPSDAQADFTVCTSDSGLGFRASKSVNLGVPDELFSQDEKDAENDISFYLKEKYYMLSQNSLDKCSKIIASLAENAKKVVEESKIEDLAATAGEAKTGYFLNIERLKVIQEIYSAFTDRQKRCCQNECIPEMASYVNNIAPPDAKAVEALNSIVISGKSEYTPLYDYYYDGKIDLLDLKSLKCYINGNLSENPYFLEKDKAEAEKEKPTYSNAKVLYSKDFGVVGDGITDDGPKITALMNALSNAPAGSSAVFEKNKTYYIGSLSTVYLFSLANTFGVTIDGNGSTFVMGALKSYFSANQTEDCTLKNAEFKFSKSPAFTAETLSVDLNNNCALMQTDFDVGLKDGEIWRGPSASWFAVLNRSDSRYHMYLSHYEMVDRANGKFKIYFEDKENTKEWMKLYLKKYGLLCPTPYLARTLERGFTIDGNRDFTMENITVRHCSKFGMYIGRNEGTLHFNNVDFEPESKAASGKADFTSWCDVFHVKDNRSKIIWQDCDIIGNYDDIFNVSSSVLYVSDYLPNSRIMTLKWIESGGLYYEIKPGDELQVIDTSTGKNCGLVKIERVLSQKDGKNIVMVSEGIENISSVGKTLQANFTNRCAPDSEVINCNINGTFRMRGPISFKNCDIFNMRMWLDYYDGKEGPVPMNIRFYDCKITGGGTIIADSYNTAQNGYHISDIGFYNCVIDTPFETNSYDSEYITVLNCKKSNGTLIENKNGIKSAKIIITDALSYGENILLNLSLRDEFNNYNLKSNEIEVYVDGRSIPGILSDCGNGKFTFTASSNIMTGYHSICITHKADGYTLSKFYTVTSPVYRAEDLVKIRKCLLCTVYGELERNDVNYDGIVNILDLVCMKKSVAGAKFKE